MRHVMSDYCFLFFLSLSLKFYKWILAIGFGKLVYNVSSIKFPASMYYFNM